MMLLTFVVFKRLCFSRKPIGWRALYQQRTRVSDRAGTATALYGSQRRFHSARRWRGPQAQRVKLYDRNVHARLSSRHLAHVPISHSSSVLIMPPGCLVTVVTTISARSLEDKLSRRNTCSINVTIASKSEITDYVCNKLDSAAL